MSKTECEKEEEEEEEEKGEEKKISVYRREFCFFFLHFSNFTT